MNKRNRPLASLAWTMLLLVASCHGEGSNAGLCPGCSTGGSPNLGTGGSGASDAAAVDSCGLPMANLEIWPDLWLDNCTVPLEMRLQNPGVHVMLAVDCVFIPYASPDAGVDEWLYDDASRTLTLAGQPCDTFKAKGMVQLYVIQAGSTSFSNHFLATFMIHYVGADAG